MILIYLSIVNYPLSHLVSPEKYFTRSAFCLPYVLKPDSKKIAPVKSKEVILITDARLQKFYLYILDRVLYTCCMALLLPIERLLETLCIEEYSNLCMTLKSVDYVVIANEACTAYSFDIDINSLEKVPLLKHLDMKSEDLVIAYEFVIRPNQDLQSLFKTLNQSQLQIALLVIHALEDIRLALLRTEECKDSVLRLTEELTISSVSRKNDLFYI